MWYHWLWQLHIQNMICHVTYDYRNTCCSRRYLGSICNITSWSYFYNRYWPYFMLHASCFTSPKFASVIAYITVPSFSDASHWIVFYFLATKAFIYFNDGFHQILVEDVFIGQISSKIQLWCPPILPGVAVFDGKLTINDCNCNTKESKHLMTPSFSCP